MNKDEMAHRWCNCDFGRNGGFRGSSVHCDETRFYSYSTVYAMWLDKNSDTQLMVVMDKACSVTSSQHLAAIKRAIPDGVAYIETHIESEYRYNNVDFSYTHWQTELPITLLKGIERLIKPFKDSKSITTRENLREIQRLSDDTNWLYDNRNDCKVKELAERLKGESKLKKVFSGVRKKLTPEQLVDVVLGKGAYATYDSRPGSQKKAARTRKFVEWFNATHSYPHLVKSAIDKMPISKKVTLACLPPLQKWEKDNLDYHVKDKRNERFARYLLGDKARVEYPCHAYSDSITNRFTGEKYTFTGIYCNGLYWKLPRDVRDFASEVKSKKGYDRPYIRLNEYKKLANKDQWLKRFYQKCAIISKRQSELILWMQMKLYSDQELNACLASSLEIYNRYESKFASYMVDVEARRMAQEEERERMEAERLRLEEERKLKYDSYVARGIEGYRNLYYEKLDSISVSNKFGNEFFFGGNVLLRWRTDELIETSKNILITIPQAKKFFKVISKWHNDPTTFNDYRFDTNSGNYNANKYENDILTAGCHKIAYCEMERMYNEILKRESV